MKRFVLTAAALVAAAFLLALAGAIALAPPRSAALALPDWRPANIVAGAIHIHTRRSDGSGTPDEVAAAAARAGLDFIIFTDHGDGTRVPDAPTRRAGVLCIDGVEISTDQGHYVALGLGRAPYRLAGEPRDVVEDVTRLGGFGIAAHPDSRKPGLQWHEWTAPFEGIEWMNADSEWRDEGRRTLLRSLFTYLVRPAESIGALLDRPDTTLLRWDALTQRRKVVAVAGADAHARLGWQDDDVNGYRARYVRLPSYETTFRAFSTRVQLPHTFSGDAMADASLLLSAIRAGHLYTSIDSMAAPAAFEFSAESNGLSAGEGDRIAPGHPVTLHARTNAGARATIVLRKDGGIVAQQAGSDLTFQAPGSAAVYRVEVFLADRKGHPPIPWIVSNPIYVQPDSWGKPLVNPLTPAVDSWPLQGGPWHVEKDARSDGRVTTRDAPVGPVDFSYQLGAGGRQGQYAALAISTGNALMNHARLSFTGRADAPMRVSVQARRTQGERWQRSVYLDEKPRDVVIPFVEMMPVGTNNAFRFEAREIDTLLFVADLVHSLPGSAGRFEITNLRVEH